MREILDLTGTIGPGMWSYGAPLPGIEVTPVASVAEHGWKAHRLLLSTLSGTYLETGDHLGLVQAPLSELAPERLVVAARVIQLREKEPLETIAAAELEAADPGGTEGGALLIATGWDQRWDDREFVSACPHFQPDAIEWICAQRPGIVGVDVPSLQHPGHDDGTLCRRVFATGALLLAPLVNMRRAGARLGLLVAAPLKVADVCGAPCRAFMIFD